MEKHARFHTVQTRLEASRGALLGPHTVFYQRSGAGVASEPQTRSRSCKKDEIWGVASSLNKILQYYLDQRHESL